MSWLSKLPKIAWKATEELGPLIKNVLFLEVSKSLYIVGFGKIGHNAIVPIQTVKS